jgi:hypothetical protein
MAKEGAVRLSVVVVVVVLVVVVVVVLLAANAVCGVCACVCFGEVMWW